MKEKVKRAKDEEVNGQGGKRGAPSPHGAQEHEKELPDKNVCNYLLNDNV